MRKFAFACLLLLAGCGLGDGGTPNGTVNADQIERLSAPAPKVVDPRATVRLQPLAAGDLDGEGLIGAGCLFTVGNRVLLAAVGSDAIVRIQGRVRHLVPSGPIGATGGFFENRRLSISVGRTEEAGVAVGEGTRWPGRINVTNRRAKIDAEVIGAWTCGA